MLWEKIKELVRFHSQAHNIPIDTLHLPDTDQPTSPFEGIQILLVDKDAKVGLDEFRITPAKTNQSGLSHFTLIKP